MDVSLFYPATGEPTNSVSFPYSAPDYPIEVLTNRNISRTASGVPIFQAHGRPAYRVTYKLESLSESAVSDLFDFLEMVRFAGSEIRRRYYSVADDVYRDVFCRVVYPTAETKLMRNVRDVTLVFEQLTHPDHVTDADSESEGTQGGGEIGDGTDDIPNITSALVATGKVGESFSYTITAEGAATITFVASGMPSWMSRVGAVLSGTPGEGDQGETDVTITATNDDGSDTNTLIVRIAIQDADPDVETFPPVALDRFYFAEAEDVISKKLLVSGTRPLSWATATGSLPPGLSFDDDTLTISGTIDPGTHDVYTWEDVVSNDFGSDTETVTFNVGVEPGIEDGDGVKSAYENETVNWPLTVTAYEGATQNESGTLPDGLTYDTATRSISGTVSEGAAGSYGFSVTFENPFGSDIAVFDIEITDDDPIITSDDTFEVASGGSVLFQVTATGIPTIAYSLSGAPGFLSIGSSSGIISGTAGSPGDYTFDVIATNGAGVDTQPFTLTVT